MFETQQPGEARRIQRVENQLTEAEIHLQKDLAIVIPAFKRKFFTDTLESIAKQTDKRFKVYIGDDASPENLQKVVQSFTDKLDITYVRFNENLGSANLVAHWNRCVQLTKNEKWVWLFSDDDIMEPTCVEQFLHFVQKNPDVDLYHFNLKIIDQAGEIKKVGNTFPEQLSSTEFFERRINGSIISTAVEYVFRKDALQKQQGFKPYDLAWCSDDATWMMLGIKYGISTIPEACVRWRYSGINISSSIDNREIVIRKTNSYTEHVGWISDFFREKQLTDTTSEYKKLKWILGTFFHSPLFSLKEKRKKLKQTIEILGYKKRNATALLFMMYMHVKGSLVKPR